MTPYPRLDAYAPVDAAFCIAVTSCARRAVSERCSAANIGLLGVARRDLARQRTSAIDYVVAGTRNVRPNSDIAADQRWTVGPLSARADCVERLPNGTVNLFFVAPGGRPKEAILLEAAMMWYIGRQMDVSVGGVFAVTSNPDYRKNGQIEWDDFFALTAIGKQVRPTVQRMEGYLRGIEERLEQLQPCLRPLQCAACRPSYGEIDKRSIFRLFKGTDIVASALAEGITDICDLHRASAVVRKRLTAVQQRQIRAVCTDTVHVDELAVRSLLTQIEYPLAYLDFECFQESVPTIDGTYSRQSIPFLFSLDRCEHPDTAPLRRLFSLEPDADTLAPLAAALVGAAAGIRSVAVYGAALERTVLLELAAVFGRFRDDLTALADRLVDFAPLFTGLAVYHPEQLGKTTLKAVFRATGGEASPGGEAPADEVYDGGDALAEFYLSRYANRDAVTNRRSMARVRAYCSADTAALRHIHAWLRQTVKDKKTPLHAAQERS